MKFKPCECGSELFYMRQKISGYGNFFINADGSEADNEDMYAYVSHRDARKHYRGANCDKIAQEAD